MGKSSITGIVIALALLSAMMIVILPASAINGTIDIAYRGAGGNYLGDTIILDGHNTFSNFTLLKITGPGLPAEGLPIYDLNGQVGSGNTVPVNEDGKWKQVWYTGTIKGQEKLQTARYYITAFDNTYPEKSSTTSVLLKKPEFYVLVSPSLAKSGDYIQLSGIVEKGSNMVQFDISDASGKTVHAYESSISGSGYFNKGFHVDMPPGVYTVTMTSPSVKSTYRNYLTVTDGPISPSAPTIAVTSSEPGTIPVTFLPVATPEQTAAPLPSGPGSLSVSSNPYGATVYIDSVMSGPTPLDLPSVPAGNHLVEIKAPGYVTYTAQVLVKTGETTSVGPTLVKGSAGSPLSPVIIICGLVAAIGLLHFRANQRKP